MSDTEIELVLYRWKDGYYGKKMLENDEGAVKAIRELFSEGAE